MKHKRMGMARIDHHLISHPYLTASSTLVSPQTQNTELVSDVFFTPTTAPSTSNSSPTTTTRTPTATARDRRISRPYRSPTSPSALGLRSPSSPSAFQASARRRGPPPKFNAEALSALAARSEKIAAAAGSSRSPRSPNSRNRLQPKSSTKTTTTEMGMDVDAPIDANMESSKTHMSSNSTSFPAPAWTRPVAAPVANDIDFFAPFPAPSRPCTPAHRIRAPFRRLASPASSRGSPGSPLPLRYRSSAAFNSMPSASPQQYKASRGRASVDRALGTMLCSLRVAAHNASPSPHARPDSSPPHVSRWSSSSEDEQTNKTSSGNWFGRKSNDSTRSKQHNKSNSGSGSTLSNILSGRSSRTAPSVRSVKSLKSVKSITSIRSVKTNSKSSTGAKRGTTSMEMEVDVDVPPVPAVRPPPATTVPTKTASASTTSNTTPSRGWRMVGGFLKRLTPRKHKQHEQPEAPQAATKDKHGRPPLTRRNTSPSLPSLGTTGASTPPPPMPAPPVPPIPAAESARNGSHPTVKSMISRQMSSATLRIGKSPRSSTSSPSGARSTGTATAAGSNTKSVSAARTRNVATLPISGSGRPPLPAFEMEPLAKHAASTPPVSKPHGIRNKNRRSISLHLPHPLPLSSFGRSSPPRAATPNVPGAGSPSASVPNTPLSPNTPNRLHLPKMARSMSRGSHNVLAQVQPDISDMHGLEGCAPRPHQIRHSKPPVSFSLHRNRSTMSMSLSSPPSSSAASSSLHLAAPTLRNLSPSAPSSPTAPVLMSRSSFFEPTSPSPSPAALLLPTSPGGASTSPSPAPSPSSTVPATRAGTVHMGSKSRRPVRNVKSMIGLPTLVSTTSETVFSAVTGRPATHVSPPPDDAVEVVVISKDDDMENVAGEPAKPAGKPKLESLVIPPKPHIPVICTEPMDASESAADTDKDEQGSTKAAASFKQFPVDSASFISTDSCYDAAEVVTFSTPVRARRATATTIFSVKGVQALASPPDSPSGRPKSPDSLGGSPKTKSMLRTLDKLEAASPCNSGSHEMEVETPMEATVAEAEPEVTKAAHASAPAAVASAADPPRNETPALCRSASDAPSASPSESDGVKTPSMPGTPLADPTVSQLPSSHSHKDLSMGLGKDAMLFQSAAASKPTPITVPLAPAAEARPCFPNLSLDLSPTHHSTGHAGTLVGKAARAAALAAANDPLKPRRLLQFLPRQQARLALHKRMAVFEPVEPMEVDKEEKEDKNKVDGKAEEEVVAAPAVPAVVDLSDDVPMVPSSSAADKEVAPEDTVVAASASEGSEPARIDPEIGLPIPPASPKSRRQSLPKLPAHLDRSRMRADSVVSRAESQVQVRGEEAVPRRWPAWPPQWDTGRAKRSRSRANTAASTAPDKDGDKENKSPTVASPTAASPVTIKKGHGASASVHTFGGSHCSGTSIANLEEFGVLASSSRNSMTALASRRQDSLVPNSVGVEDEDAYGDYDHDGEEVFADSGHAAKGISIDFSRRRPRAGTTATVASAWSLSMGIGAPAGMDVDMDEERAYVVSAAQ